MHPEIAPVSRRQQPRQPASQRTEAVQERQRKAARVAKLKKMLDQVQDERARLRCDLSRGQVS